MKTIKLNHRSPFAVRVAVGALLGVLATGSAVADPLLAVKIFRDSEMMFRDSDMSRYVDNYFEIGAGYNSNNSFRFGQYSGLTKDGGFGFVNFNLLQRSDDNDSRYSKFYGSNLGLGTRKVRVESGLQGSWDVSLGVDQLLRSEISDGKYVFEGLGSNSLTLGAGCSGFTSANSTTNGAINGCLHGFEVKQGRDIYRFAVGGRFNPEWDYKVNFREDQRNGTRVTGMYFTNALNVPYGIDDHTQQMDAVLSYATKRAQWQLGYQFSRYDNNEASFTVANPFTLVANNRIGRMSLAPENEFHQINTSGAYNVSKTTRLTGGLAYAVATQNEAFLPYSATSAALTSGASNTPTLASLDGKLVTKQADLALLFKPVDKANVKLSYQYRENDNSTRTAEYVYISRDSNAGPANKNSANYRTNVPVSTTEQKFTADGDYEIAPRSYLRTVLERQRKTYTASDRTETNTDKLSIELRRPVSDEVSGNVGYTYTQRTGSDYDKGVYFRSSYNPAYQIGAAKGMTNHPSMRSFIYGDYAENRIRTAANWTATETVSLQASLDGFRQVAGSGPNCDRVDALQALSISTALPNTCLGRTLATGGSVNLDVQWQPEENLTTFAFANWSTAQTDIRGRTWSNAVTTTAGDLKRDWFGNILNRDQAVGLGMKWQPALEWDLGATYVYSRGNGTTDVQTSLNPGVVPDTSNLLNSLQLFAKWDYSKRMSWRFNYVHETLDTSDWMYDNAATGSNNAVLFTGQTSARYINNVLGVSLTYKTK